MRHFLHILLSITLTLAFVSQLKLSAAEPEYGAIEVKIGETIERTWDEVRTDNYAYGPKQEIDAKTGETRIYMPYGNNTRLYAEVKGKLTDASRDGQAKFSAIGNAAQAVLTYKVHFDKPIISFRYTCGRAEVRLSASTVAGVEYSADGVTWKTMREIKGSEKPQPSQNALVSNFKAVDVNSNTLYIRHFARDPKALDTPGPGRGLDIWMAGDPNWGDAFRTFFQSQPQLYVKAVN